MDAFQTIRTLTSVKKVSNLPANHPQPLTCLFFLCPALNSKGIRLNSHGTGMTAKYADKLSGSTQERLQLVKSFQKEICRTDICCKLVAIYATADPLILFSPPTGPPKKPELPFPAVTNYQVVYERLVDWHQFYCDKPWQQLPQKFVEQGEKRLSGLLPENCPLNVGEDFVRRVMAGFALDGLLIKLGCFGDNPVLLGVESPEVAVLQNATLSREERIPVIQLA